MSSTKFHKSHVLQLSSGHIEKKLPEILHSGLAATPLLWLFSLNVFDKIPQESHVLQLSSGHIEKKLPEILHSGFCGRAPKPKTGCAHYFLLGHRLPCCGYFRCSKQIARANAKRKITFSIMWTLWLPRSTKRRIPFLVTALSLAAYATSAQGSQIPIHGCDTLFELELLTDEKGAETQFSLIDSRNNVVLSRTAGSYEADSRYTETLCLPKNEVFNFTIQGGNGTGDFAIFLQGKMIGAGAMTVEPFESHRFDTLSNQGEQFDDGDEEVSEQTAALRRVLKPKAKVGAGPPVPKAIKASKAPVAPKASKAPTAPKATKAPKGVKAPTVPKAPKAAKGTKVRV